METQAIIWHDPRVESEPAEAMIESHPEKTIDTLNDLPAGFYIVGPKGNFVQGPYDSQDAADKSWYEAGKYAGERLIHIGAALTEEEAAA